MGIKRMIGDTASSALAQIRGNSIKGEPPIDRSAVGKFLEDLPKSINGTRALSIEKGVAILLPQADIDKITSPKTPPNTQLTLRTLVDNSIQSEAGLRSITVGELLPYLANDQIQREVKQSKLDPEQLLAIYKDKQVDNSRSVLAKPVSVAASPIVVQNPNVALNPNVAPDTIQQETLKISTQLETGIPDFLSIQVPVEVLDQDVRASIGSALAKPVSVAESLSVAKSPSVKQDETPEEALNISRPKSTEQPDSLIHVPVRALHQQYVEDPITKELIQRHEMQAQDLRDLLPSALQAQLFPVENWKDISMVSPRIFIVRQDLFNFDLMKIVNPAESDRLSDDSSIDSLAPNPTTLNDSANTSTTLNDLANTPTTINDSANAPTPTVKTQQRTRTRSSAINKSLET